MLSKVSIVINTYNRAVSLENTLKSLKRLNYPNFEVIVVNGPSTDNTEEILNRFARDIKIGKCPAANLSVSRNIGICMASGDIVAFIDDDVIPEPEWLNEIVAGYDSDEVAGVGGFVYNHTGYEWQSKHIICNRFGGDRYEFRHNPTAYYNFPYTNEYCASAGGNSSFRLDVLLEIGGFDEEFDYYLDETDVCLRIVDRGYVIKFVDKANVHHKSLPSHVRNDRGVVKNWFPIIKNKTYFALKNASKTNSFSDILLNIKDFVNDKRKYIQLCISQNLLTEDAKEEFEITVSRAKRDGMYKGLAQERRFIAKDNIERNRSDYKPFEILKPVDGKKLVICYLSQAFPPEYNGGIARFTHDLAYSVAKMGHQVHVIIRGRNHNTVDFEDGVWIHRIVSKEHELKDIPPDLPIYRSILISSKTIYEEVLRINTCRKIDIIEAPIWDAEGLKCIEDNRFNTIISLETPVKIVAENNTPEWQSSPDIKKMIETEEWIFKNARFFHAISRGILKTVEDEYDIKIPDEKISLVPLGIKDESRNYSRKRTDNHIMILFVGRLEKRKGIDLLLEIAPELIEKFSNIRFVIVGDSSMPNERGRIYKDEFLEKNSDRIPPGRIEFTGRVNDRDIYQYYADCDIFVAPSRYESFGLIFLEAMMFSKPVIGCDAGGMAEIIRDNENGFLSKPGDAESLKRALEELITNAGMREEFGKRSREIFEASFTAERMAFKMVEFYRSIISKMESAKENKTGGRYAITN